MRLRVAVVGVCCVTAAKRSQWGSRLRMRAILTEGCQHQCSWRGIGDESLVFPPGSSILVASLSPAVLRNTLRVEV